MGDALDESEAVANAGSCSPNEAQDVPPDAGNNISAGDILEPPLWSVGVVGTRVKKRRSSSSPELARVFSPYFWRGVDERDRQNHRLPFPDPARPVH